MVKPVILYLIHVMTVVVQQKITPTVVIKMSIKNMLVITDMKDIACVSHMLIIKMHNRNFLIYARNKLIIRIILVQ